MMRARSLGILLALAFVFVAPGCGDSSDRTADLTASPASTAAGSASSTVATSPPTGAGTTPGVTAGGRAITATTATTATTAAPPATPPVPASTSPPPAAVPGHASVVVLVRGAGFCTNIPTLPSPQCDPKPLAGAEVQVLTTGGVTVSRGTTGSDGTVSFALAPGAYVAESLAVPGFDERARPAPVEARSGETTRVVLTHNTGFQ